MKHLDLFAGVGGFSLAASRVWPDHEIVGFCEIDPFCQKVLKKHWPGVPIYDDIKKLKGSDFGTVDLISGGFPCQGFSVAGKQRGKEDDRYLWPEMCRVIEEAKPRWVLGENVPGIINMALDDVLSDLGSLGYETTAFIIPACAVNAPHRRDRVWIIANRTNPRVEGLRRKWENTIFQISDAPDTGLLRPPKYEKQTAGIKQCGEDATDTSNQRLQGSEWQGSYEKKQAAYGSVAKCRDAWNEPWIEVASRLCVLDARLPTGLAGRRVIRNKYQSQKLKALGNAVVVPLVEQIFKAIKEADK